MSRVVLVVDDDPAVARLVGAVLAREGVRSELAFDGMTALARLQRGGIALVLTDMTMPGMSGLELVRAAEARGCCAPFLLMSAFLDLATERTLLAEPGIAGLLRKPFEIARLMADVRALLVGAEGAGRDAEPACAEVIAATGEAPDASLSPCFALAPLWLFERWSLAPAARSPSRTNGAAVRDALAAPVGVSGGAPLTPC